MQTGGNEHEDFMRRSVDLATKGAGYVAPNPMVGAVLVHSGKIIGEGYHERYGEAHAEVNCLRDAIGKGHHDKFSQSTLYVTLEPCAHFGKTPPCADMIIAENIPKVVVGCRDPFVEVNGKGIEKLRAAGIDVTVGIFEEECRELNKRFFTFQEKRRPYLILKWAQSMDGMMSVRSATPRVYISNDLSARIVHSWRSEEAGIMVGTNTALNDDPELTTRLWEGPSPLRIVLDRTLRLPKDLKLFTDGLPTLVLNNTRSAQEGAIIYQQLSADKELVPAIVEALYENSIQSVLIEGGQQLLQAFIAAELWDEARVITNTGLIIGDGLPSPAFRSAKLVSQVQYQSDLHHIYQPLPA